MKMIIILFLLTSLSSLTYSKDTSCQVYLKSKATLDIKISTFKKWGIITDDKRTISYKVISKIKTENQAILDSLNLFIENLVIEENNAYYLIDFSMARILILKGRVLSHIIYRSINIGHSFEKNNGFNSVLEFSPRSIENMFFRYGFTSGSISEDNVGNFSFYFGIGFEMYRIYSGSLSSSINYKVNARINQLDGWFLSLNYKHAFKQFNNLLLFADLSYIASELGNTDERDKLNFWFGLGFAFSKKP